MPLARINDQLIFFVHIPKCGGSSIEEYLSRKGQLGFKLRGRKGWAKTVPQHIHAEIHIPLFPDGFVDHSFAVVRDPVQRLISEYRYRATRSGEFKPFGDWLDNNLAKFQSNTYALDNHLRPQSEFLRKGMYIFRFEDGLDAVFDWLDQITGTDPADRKVWEKRSQGPKPDLSEESLARIRAFYAEDIALYAKLEPGKVTLW